MAKQHGINPFTGKLGDVVGRKLNGEFITSAPGGFTKEGLKQGKDGIYKKTFENATEFSRCSRLATAIYNSVDRKEFVSNIYSKTHTSLVGTLVNFLKYDTTHPKGKREPNEISLLQLTDFPFNPPASQTIKHKIPITNSDETTLTVTLTHGSAQFKWPDNAAAIQLFFHLIPINLATFSALPPAMYAEEWRKDEIPTNYQIPIQTSLCPSLLLIGARFMEEVNGKYYLFYTKQDSPLYIAHFVGC